MKLLIIGGMHGNEPLGKELVKSLQQKPIKNVDAVYGNELAVAKNRRYIKKDLNRSFPGDSKSKKYESRRAAELLELAKKYDVVLDFHNTHCPDNDCGFVGAKAQSILLDISSWLSIKRVVEADYDCINKYAANCLSIEVSLASSRMDIYNWREDLARLARKVKVPKLKSIEKYRFVYRLTLEDKEKFRMSELSMKAFRPISEKLAGELGVTSPAFPVFIADKYTPYNYGGLLNKIK